VIGYFSKTFTFSKGVAGALESHSKDKVIIATSERTRSRNRMDWLIIERIGRTNKMTSLALKEEQLNFINLIFLLNN
jgi:hypothetical protein